MTKMFGWPWRSEVNAICRPVGDHVGSASIPRFHVSRRTAPVAMLIT